MAITRAAFTRYRPTAIQKMMLGTPEDIRTPNTGGARNEPTSRPEYTKPKTLPEAPGGVALRTIMSRDGLVMPPAAPAKASSGSNSAGGPAWAGSGTGHGPARTQPR